MRLSPLSAMAALAIAAGMTSQASAATVFAQKGNVCTGVWETGQAAATPQLPANKPWTLACTDGDPNCDADGLVNGACAVRLSACALQAGPICTPEVLTKFKVNGVAKNKFHVGLPTTTSASCGTPGSATLTLKGKNGKPPKASKKLKVLINFKSTPTGKGKNALIVQCNPNPSCTVLPCGGTAPPVGSGCTSVCTNDPSKLGQPKQICLTTPLPDPTTNSNGSDLDTGFTGISHNFPVVGGSTVRYCLSNCDGISDNTCDGVGTTGGGSQNGETFGAPLALFSGGVPVCVVNRYQPGNLTGTFDLSTGVSGDPTPNAINLFSDTYLRFGLNSEVCPRCNVPGGGGADAIGKTGTCSNSSRTPGADCTVDGFMHLSNQTTGNADYTLSSSCIPPSDANNPTVLSIPLTLTTGTAMSNPGPNPCATVGQVQDDNCGGGSCTASCTGCTTTPNGCIDPKGGIAQLCCSGNTDSQTGSCFATKNGGTITRTGRPGTGTGTNGVLFATTFCIAATNASLINSTAGLPGPGALLLPSDVQVLTHTAQ